MLHDKCYSKGTSPFQRILFRLLFILPASHISFKTMEPEICTKSELTSSSTKIVRNNKYLLCLNLEKPGLLKWLQLLCCF